MIQIPATANILVMHEPISFRNGIDGTAAIARLILKYEPMDGAFFVFRNKAGHSLRILHYDGGGFWLATKRLSRGRFSPWPKAQGEIPCSSLLARELQILIWAGDWSRCNFPELWRKIS